jgi:hypothetical protein
MGEWDDDTEVQRKAQLRLLSSLPALRYKIQPHELMRLASHLIQCPKCSGVFDETGGRKPISTS